MDIHFHNTLGNKKELFKPLKEKVVSMYHCGPTVYNFPSIGNMRSYVFADILRRTFEYFDYDVNQIINITDVGHLVGDGDLGEDKVEKTAKASGKSAKEVAELYEKSFHNDLRDLNIETSKTKFPKASEHIEEQLAIIKKLEEKGFTYQTSDGVYFDTSKFLEYGKLGGINLAGQKEGARIGINEEKKNKSDFALWKFSNKDEKRLQEWQSPWGTGFPGWHIECSAMSQKYLGQPFDIHTGGIDHVPVHHNNEIAQSECAFDRPLANYWLHNEFLMVEGEKMSKSLGNILTLSDLKKRKVHPLSFRFWLLSAKYSSPLNFTWDSVIGSQNAFEKVISSFDNLKSKDGSDKDILDRFEKAITDDLNSPIAIALLQEAKSKHAILEIDKVLGLDIKKMAKNIESGIPEEILEIKSERDEARKAKDWHKSDKLREEIEKEGYVLEDQDGKSIIRKTLAGIV